MDMSHFFQCTFPIDSDTLVIADQINECNALFLIMKLHYMDITNICVNCHDVLVTIVY